MSRTSQQADTVGVPLCAVAVDEHAQRLGPEAVTVSAHLAGQMVPLAHAGRGVWTNRVKGLPVGKHRAVLTARPKRSGKSLVSSLQLRITDGRFVGYDPALKLLTLAGRPIGPLTGSYRGAPMFKAIGTPAEALVQGQAN